MAEILTTEERQTLRALQDRFLALPATQRYIERYGEDAPLYGTRGPSARELRMTLFPSALGWLERTLREFTTE